MPLPGSCRGPNGARCGSTRIFLSRSRTICGPGPQNKRPSADQAREPPVAGPPASDAAALRRMRKQQRSGTLPELALRRALWARGLRYRVNVRLPLTKLRRTADVAFLGPRVAVFVDGCFWHDCPVHGTRPKANASWWTEEAHGERPA